MFAKSQALICLVVFTFAGCQALPEADQELLLSGVPAPLVTDSRPVYRLGVPPMHSTRRLWNRYQPLVDQVNAQITGFRLELESAQTEYAYEEKCHKRVLDLVLMEPHRVLDAEKDHYAVIAQTGARDRIAGLIVVRRNAGIHRVSDLRGRTISFSSPQALASTMMVRMWLREAAFPLNHAQVLYSGSQEGALWNVLLGRSEAAGVSRDGWQSFTAQYSFARQQMEARWQTDNLPGSALMAQQRLSTRDRREIANAFQKLRSTPGGKAALEQAGISEFRFGESATYDPVWEFLGQYQSAFGSIPARRIAP